MADGGGRRDDPSIGAKLQWRKEDRRPPLEPNSDGGGIRGEVSSEPNSDGGGNIGDGRFTEIMSASQADNQRRTDGQFQVGDHIRGPGDGNLNISTLAQKGSLVIIRDSKDRIFL